MKNAIIYYYNLHPNRIYKEKNYLYFYLNDIKICIHRFERNLIELPELVRVSNELYKSNVKVSTFVMTIDKKFYFEYEEENYILLKINNYEQNYIDLYDISNFNNFLSSRNKDVLNNLPWNITWSNRVDMLEETMKEFNKEYIIIQDKIHYYIGLAENAILYITNAFEENKGISINQVLSHKYVNINMDLLDYYNPINFMFDYEVRDLSYYIQSAFFNNIFDLDEFEKYLNYKNFNRFSIELFFGRLLYPSYYFDKVEKIILEEIDEKVLHIYHDKTSEYEDFLYDIYNLLNSKYNIPSVDWINNN